MAAFPTVDDALQEFFFKVIDSIIQDAAAKGQKIPEIWFEIDSQGNGIMMGPAYFKYLIHGRPPGKQPPVQKMIDWLVVNPDIVSRLQQVYKYLTAEQAGFLIARKIGREGTDIWQGKKPGIDLVGSLEKHMPDLLANIAQAEVFRIATQLRKAVK